MPRFVLFIDTCVWLDLAKDPSSEPILQALSELRGSDSIKLVCPSLIKDEFNRNKERVSEVATQRLSQEFKRIRRVVDQYGNNEKSSVIGALDEIQHKLPIATDAVFGNVSRIGDLLEASKHQEIPTEVIIRSSNRALENLAPFHKNKNSMADAMLIELFLHLADEDKTAQYIFVTHNTKDFSSPSDNRKPHEDFEDRFQRARAKYSIDLADTIKCIDPEFLEDYIAEYEWAEETRGLYEILDNIDAFVEKIWFNRHCGREQLISEGKIRIVDKEEYEGYSPGVIRADIWEGALRAAEAVRAKYPGELGPFSDFEWGMLNGKLSALRWVLGDDWDNLDT